MIHFVLMFVKWVALLSFALPVMFLFGVKVFDQWVAGDFSWDRWEKMRKR